MSQPELFHDLPLEEVIGDRFGRYSKYIIQDRALPDARDGLKPVQRRILYAMHTDGNTFDKNFRKAAKTVGNVIGNYHPHGDSSVYEAMVRMSQDWKVRNVLIEMHGNNGSIDGDPPAAMRYTEARLSPIASELLRDIDKNTVEFVPNFDDTSKESLSYSRRCFLTYWSTDLPGFQQDTRPTFPLIIWEKSLMLSLSVFKCHLALLMNSWKSLKGLIFRQAVLFRALTG